MIERIRVLVLAISLLALSCACSSAQPASLPRGFPVPIDLKNPRAAELIASHSALEAAQADLAGALQWAGDADPDVELALWLDAYRSYQGALARYWQAQVRPVPPPPPPPPAPPRVLEVTVVTRPVFPGGTPTPPPPGRMNHALVQVYPAAGGARTAFTGSDGIARFTGLSEGPVRVTATANQYYLSAADVTVGPGTTQATLEIRFSGPPVRPAASEAAAGPASASAEDPFAAR